MWDIDKGKIHLAGHDEEDNRLTDYARGTIHACLFSGKMYVELNTSDRSKILLSGLVSRVGIYDHCGNFWRSMTLADPVEVSKGRFAATYLAYDELTITLKGTIGPE